MRGEGSAEVWGEVGGGCRRGEDCIMTGLSLPNGVWEGGSRGGGGGGRTKLVRMKDWGFSFSGMG